MASSTVEKDKKKKKEKKKEKDQDSFPTSSMSMGHTQGLNKNEAISTATMST
jgi:hypothetical protein